MARPELDPGVSRVSRVLARLGNPERSFACVHVAGTNGKGSVCALVEAALRASGSLAVGRFTSPFLREPRDAVWLRGAPPSPAAWDAALAQVLAAERAADAAAAGADAGARAPPLGALTTFELWTAASFLLFRDARLDVAVVEVGVGGRDDATNVLPTPAVAVVTSISLDHVELLGPALADIAAHKAGIIKGADAAGEPRPVAVMSPGQAPAAAAVVRARAAEVGAGLVEAAGLEWLDDEERGAAQGSPAATAASAAPAAPTSPLAAAADSLGRRLRLVEERPAFAGAPPAATPLRLRMALQGRFQLDNGGAALAALRALQADPRRRFAALSDAAIAEGFASAAWPGRLEAVRLRVGGGGDGGVASALLDGGHNEGALPYVREAVDDLLAARSRGADAAGGGPGATFVYACSASRPLASVLPLLLRAGDRLLAVPFTPPEGMAWVRPHAPEAVVAAAAALFGGAVDAQAVRSLGDALAKVRADELCVLCGSLYLVADAHRSGAIV